MRTLGVAAAALVLAPAALAAPPTLAVGVSAGAGAAPFTVTLTATGDAASYAWELGDGSRAEGPVVRHTYPAGRYTARVTATSAEGETSTASVQVLSLGISLAPPATAAYRGTAVLRGRLAPHLPGAKVWIYRGDTYVTTATLRAGGSFSARLLARAPGAYHARVGSIRSAETRLRLRPALELDAPALAAPGRRVRATARLVPRSAGTVRVSQKRSGGAVVVTARSVPRAGWEPVSARARVAVVAPTLAVGARGPSVLALERRLAELRFALRRADSVYAHDTFEAVLAVQKLHGLPRTGRVDAATWRALATASVPRPRHPAPRHLWVSKSRQLLFEVEGGEVTRIVHVSTGATGNTPVGRWTVYRKVTGWDWVLWYPMYFLRGFAVHGYPSVPAYPASHGCVRVPMWIAPQLFARHRHGSVVYVDA